MGRPVRSSFNSLVISDPFKIRKLVECSILILQGFKCYFLVLYICHCQVYLLQGTQVLI